MPAPLLYPAAPPIRIDTLTASNGHRLHVQQWGQLDGIAALVLHGGPGSGCSPLLARFFDPARYRVICPDQRGAGASEPRGGLAHNTTADLLDDLRRLRVSMGVRRWLVVGGSWGAALALAYAAVEPDAVSALLLRGSFLARGVDLQWFFDGAASERPQAWARFAAGAPPDRRHAMLEFLTQGLIDGDPAQRPALALAWWHWEQALAAPAAEPPQSPGAAIDDAPAAASLQALGASIDDAPAAALPQPTGAAIDDAPAAAPPQPSGAAIDGLIRRYRVQAHYLRHRCWLDDPPLIERCARVPPVPTLLLHGREDRVCLPEGALSLHRALPHSTLRWVDGAGHDPSHPAMVAAMVSALDHYAGHRRFDAEHE